MSDTGFGALFLLALATAAIVAVVALLWQALRTWQVGSMAGDGGARDQADHEPLAAVSSGGHKRGGEPREIGGRSVRRVGTEGSR